MLIAFALNQASDIRVVVERHRRPSPFVPVQECDCMCFPTHRRPAVPRHAVLQAGRRKHTVLVSQRPVQYFNHTHQ